MKNLKLFSSTGLSILASVFVVAYAAGWFARHISEDDAKPGQIQQMNDDVYQKVISN